MENESTLKGKLTNWFTKRYPIQYFLEKHVTQYYAPKNFNFWYYFGSFSLLVLAIQIITGIWLAMVYVPTSESAFASVEHIMREVKFGWLLRYMHTTGASAFFVVVYLHMYRAIMYGSYKAPRELLWIIGVFIYLTLLLEAFTGYVLPWGQMSYWGAQVITSFTTAIPFIGKALALWVRGDYAVTGVTLHRFFALHVIAVPLILLYLVFIHLIALHYVGSNNPEGIEIKKHLDNTGKPIDSIPFHPYYTVKDLMGVMVFLFIFAFIVFFTPEVGGLFLEPDNFIPANPLSTPADIAPVWYMTPFYAILRAIPNKLMGLLIMASSIALLFVLPWLDRSPVKSIRYKGVYSKIALVFFIISFIGLGYLGAHPVSPTHTLLARIFTVFYFAFFLAMPFYTRYERSKLIPERLLK